MVLERLLSRYGQVVTVTGADGIPQEGRAFVQPICETGETALQVCPTPLGTRRVFVAPYMLSCHILPLRG